jgi:hypothetical protein
MRIIRNDDHHDHDRYEDGHEHRDRPPRDPKVLAEIFVDEVSDFLAATADLVPFTPGHDAPAEPTAPQPVDHVLRLVKIDDDTTDEPTDPEPAADAVVQGRASVRPRLLRAGIGGSSVVVAAVVVAAWGEPAEVMAPVGVYGVGWIAYLWWNAALRPPLPQVLAVIATAISRSTATLARGITGTGRASVARVDTANAVPGTRTATA